MFQPACANTKSGAGFTLMPVVLIILGLVVVIGAFVLLIGYNSFRNSAVLVNSYRANSLVNACVEKALFQIQQNGGFIGSGTVTLNTGACSYNVESLGGQQKKITAFSAVVSAIRKAELLVATAAPAIFITKWQEVAD